MNTHQYNNQCDRSFIKAKRRCNENDAFNMEQKRHRFDSGSSDVAPGPPPPTTKNIASARMKRLRETLQEDVIQSSSASPTKRFAAAHSAPVIPASPVQPPQPQAFQQPQRTPSKHQPHSQSHYSQYQRTERSPANAGKRHTQVSPRSRARQSKYSQCSQLGSQPNPQSRRRSQNLNNRFMAVNEATVTSTTPQPLLKTHLHPWLEPNENQVQNTPNSYNVNAFRQETANSASQSHLQLFNNYQYSNMDNLNVSQIQTASHSHLSSFNDYSNFNNSNVSLAYSNNSTSSTSVPLANSFEAPFDDSMDWSPISEETLLCDLRQAREMLHEQHQEELDNVPVPPGAGRKLSTKNVYVIVDTNIFIDKLQTVINIMHIVYADDSFPVIYVPWMVVQELDYFKDGYSVSDKHPISKVIQTRCRKAVRFINDCLIALKQNFRGQPVHRAADCRIKGQSPDDSIISCCMQLTNERHKVILLSSDTNLRNKALISGINATSPVEIVKELTKLKSTKKRRSYIDEISKKLSLICSFVLHFEIKQYYGEREYDSKGFKALPWQFKDCIKYFRESYDAVFQAVMQKQCRKVVDDLYELLFVNEAIANEVKYTELCLSLLIYLQNALPRYDSNIQVTIQEIKKLETEFK